MIAAPSANPIRGDGPSALALVERRRRLTVCWVLVERRRRRAELRANMISWFVVGGGAFRGGLDLVEDEGDNVRMNY